MDSAACGESAISAGQARGLGDENRRLADELGRLRYQVQAHERLAATVAAGGGVQAIADVVHELSGVAVEITDGFGHVRALAGRADTARELSTRDWTALLDSARRAAAPVHCAGRLVALVQRGGELLGTLGLHDPHRTAGERHLLALDAATAVLTAELVQTRALAEVELRLRRDLLDDLLSGTDAESALARADALGHDLRARQRVFLVQGGEDGRGELLGMVARAADDLGIARLLGRRSGVVVALAQRPVAWKNTRSEWTDLHETIQRHARGTPLAIGVGGPFQGPGDAPRSYRQARGALAVRRGARTSDGVTVHDDLGVYRILDAGRGGREIELFVREWLGDLLDNDARHDSELVRTLATYLECGGNYDRSARELVIHRSTLRYRLKRIRAVSGRDLNDVDQRLNLHVATRALTVMGG